MVAPTFNLVDVPPSYCNRGKASQKLRNPNQNLPTAVVCELPMDSIGPAFIDNNDTAIYLSITALHDWRVNSR